MQIIIYYSVPHEKKMRIPKKNIDLEKLGLINQGLFEVDGILAQRYNDAIKRIFGYDIDIDSFRIDKRGLSPELGLYVMKKYPEDNEYPDSYLNMHSANRFMLVVSPDQRDSPLIAPQTSYDDEIFSNVHHKARMLIQDVAQDEILFGELKNGISIFEQVEDVMQLKNIGITLDTLDDTVAKTLRLINLGNGLSEGDNALDASYIKQMADLVKIVGDPRKGNISAIFPVEYTVQNFYVEFFNGAHYLKVKKRGQIKSLFVTDNQPFKWEAEEVSRYDLHDTNLLDVLHDYKLVRYDTNLISQRLAEIEADVLLNTGVDVVDLSDYEMRKLIVRNASNFPNSYRQLRDVDRILSQTSAKFSDLESELSYESRLKLSIAKSDENVVNHMLAELDPTDIARYFQSNRAHLLRSFQHMPANRQRYIAQQLLNHKEGK
ncbi:hypothetical protein H6503_06960 [Candidatus Woesearchaeota archaeon]|nr:hypothetical protein [Candidatus Woesearchaeota archaeon]